jgi:hypothetical protein
MIFARAFAAVGLVPASELADALERYKKLEESHQNLADSSYEFANSLGQARDALENANERLEQALGERTQVADSLAVATMRIRSLEQQVASQEEIIRNQNGDLEIANALIAELQRPPQLKLVDLEPKTARVMANDAADELIEKPHDVVLVCRLIAIVFEGDRKHWTLRRDDVQFTVPVHDKAFLERVHTGKQQFAADYLIRGRFSEVTLRRVADGDLYTKRSLEEVLDVITPDTQTTFEPASPATAEAL